ncbi:hypothetical protein KSF_005670 [Reticulibacter mediterranei]|uniref:Uncharacterized protein n=1 Tax=Reticulibacter mediterranei TaxID=2778369 RepID=A0A8J3MX33_9CHLR|nr:hypothetical protein KSF_005670 [Reticulibacter mediterranei]
MEGTPFYTLQENRALHLDRGEDWCTTAFVSRDVWTHPGKTSLGDLYIEQQEAGTTLLSGALPDQSALYRVLLQLIQLGLVLLSLETSQAEGA